MGLLDLIGHKYPFTDFHELNLDWCISAVLQLQKAFEDFSAGNKLIFADPLQHDLTKTYAKNTIVIGANGNAYMSLQPVPVGVALGDTEYWLMVFDFEDYTEKANKNFSDNYFSNTDRSPYALAVDDWVVLDDVLYKVIQAIAADGLFIIGTNIVHFTIEQFLKDFVTYVNNTLTNYSLTIQQYKNDIDASELQYKNEIDASELAYRNQLAQDIADTTASLQAQLNAAISGATVDSEVINARVGANNVIYSTLGDAIRTQVSLLLNTIKTSVDYGVTNVVSDLALISGRLNASTGAYEASQYYVTSDDYYTSDDIIFIYAEVPLTGLLLVDYLADGTYQGRQYFANNYIYKKAEAGHKYRFCFAHDPMDIISDPSACTLDVSVFLKNSEIIYNITSMLDDICTGADGINYSSPSEAINTQFENLLFTTNNSVNRAYIDPVQGIQLVVGKILSADGTLDPDYGASVSTADYFTSDSLIYIEALRPLSGLMLADYLSDGTYQGYKYFDGETLLTAAQSGHKYKITFARNPSEYPVDPNDFLHDFVIFTKKAAFTSILDDICTGADGITYSSPSEAINTQFENLLFTTNNSVNRAYIDPVQGIQLVVGKILSADGTLDPDYGASVSTADYFTSDSLIYIEALRPLSGLMLADYLSDGTYQGYKYFDGETLLTAAQSGHKYKITFARNPSEYPVDPNDFLHDFVLFTKRADFINDVMAAIGDVRSKKWVAMGDSLTDPNTLSGEAITKNYTDIVSEQLDLILTNLGKGGTGYWRGSHKTTGSAAHRAFYQITDDIPVDADIVTLFGSFNDMGSDDYDGSGTEVRGYYILTREKLAEAPYPDSVKEMIDYTVDECMYMTFDNIFTRVPNAIVGVILPTPWEDMLYDEDDTVIYEEYIQLLTHVAHSRGLPVLDLFHECNLRPWDDTFVTKYYKTPVPPALYDRDHPNYYGHSRIAGKIADFIKAILSDSVKAP